MFCRGVMVAGFELGRCCAVEPSRARVPPRLEACFDVAL